ncbi:DUF3231 family protein [Pseudalkalibacillus sp. R45]|uniref:DUF3231 family protein n=1 Tax=Pseudalkalibacillus sp. R45 TaxID=3457433 RepID=UPI003FCCF4F8
MGIFKPFHGHEKLTSAEIGKLWVTYTGNTMGKCVLTHFIKNVEDEDIKKVVEKAIDLSEEFIQKIEDIFIPENFPIPVGFTEKDVNPDAPRLFSDQFYLHYLRYVCKAGLSIYSIAIPLMSRKDIREFFTDCSTKTANLIREVNEILIAKGSLAKPVPIPIPEEVDFVEKHDYLNGVIGNVRPLHALEITHLFDNIDNNVTSKALLIGFSQVANRRQIRQYLLRGKKITNKHIVANSQKLNKDNLPAPPLLDHLVTTSTVPTFSDKLMLAHKIDMFSMKIRSCGNAMSLNGRRDLGGMYAKMLTDISLYVEDGAQIMINHGWMEKPPQAVDRDKLKNADQQSKSSK